MHGQQKKGVQREARWGCHFGQEFRLEAVRLLRDRALR